MAERRVLVLLLLAIAGVMLGVACIAAFGHLDANVLGWGFGGLTGLVVALFVEKL